MIAYATVQSLFKPDCVYVNFYYDICCHPVLLLFCFFSLDKNTSWTVCTKKHCYLTDNSLDCIWPFLRICSRHKFGHITIPADDQCIMVPGHQQAQCWLQNDLYFFVHILLFQISNMILLIKWHFQTLLMRSHEISWLSWISTHCGLGMSYSIIKLSEH